MGITKKKKKEIDPGIDRSLSFLWKKNHHVTSECEDYLSVIQDQELQTKYVQYKRVLDKGNIQQRILMYVIKWANKDISL